MGRINEVAEVIEGFEERMKKIHRSIAYLASHPDGTFLRTPRDITE